MIEVFEFIVVILTFIFFGLVIDLTNKYFKNHRDEK